MGKYQKNIETARRITVMQYLETYHPGELVRKTDREYCTRTHDSLIITPANGFFHWFSRHVGGNNAIDYLTKVEGIQRNLRCGAGRLCTGGCGFYRTVGLYCARWQHTDQNPTGSHRPQCDCRISFPRQRNCHLCRAPHPCGDQCVPGDHYGNQIRIWGGLNQLSLGDADDLPAVFSADEGEEISLLDFCASIYDDVQMYIIENFPESTAAEIYLASADELANGVETYASARGYYIYIYNPGRAGWQTVALIGPEIGEEEPEPEPVVQEYYASWEAPAQTASGSFDFSYGIRTDKIQLKTQEKVDGATIEIEPITKSGSIDGGSWSVSPASKQTVTTSGHTADDNYQKNGGDAAASWSLHYAVTKTSGTLNGRVGPYTSQEAADEAANSARDAALAELQAEAQNAVNAAVSSAKTQLGSLQFRYEEISVPYGFEKYWGSNGSYQTLTVPANSDNEYLMRNAEWSLQVNIRKTDSETGNPIAADACYEIYQWDSVSNKFLAAGGYNTYSVQHQGDGSYAVINSAAYAVNDAMRHTLYYTQRNQGKFILVETKAPAGYFGDWTDIDHPGTAGTPLGKRAYYIEITQNNNNSVLWLDNADYNADILTADKGGTNLVTGGGVETTVSIYSTAKDSTRTYSTDNSGKAANEDSYTTTATDGVMKNDRTLGEISISKVDLDAGKYVKNHGNATLDGAVYDLYAAEDITHKPSICFSDAHFHTLFGFPPAGGRESVLLVCPHCRLGSPAHSTST